MSYDIYLRSDDHFGHRNICRFTDRPWANWDVEDVEADDRALLEMAEVFVTLHNEQVKPGDLVIFAGDVAMGDRYTWLRKWVRMMHGRKILIVGNHDRLFHSNYAEWEYRVYAETFTEGIRSSLFLQDLVPDYRIPMRINHFPYEAGSGPRVVPGPDKFKNWRPSRVPGQWLLHGHTHDTCVLTGDHQIHIGIDADYSKYGVKNYRPIPLDVIESIIKNEGEI